MRKLLFILSIIFCLILDVSWQSKAYGNTQGINNDAQNVTSQFKLKDIQICPWKFGAKTCLNFSFDDNNKSHARISHILDTYGFKGSFFVITTGMYVDSLKDIIKRGHEVGSHSVNHPDLSVMDSIGIDFQVRRSKQIIDSVFGIHCLSFAEPGHLKSELSTRITFNYYSYIRNYSEYSSINRTRFSYSTLTTGSSSLYEMMTELKNSVKNHTMFLLAGHGLDNEGYVPTSESLLVQTIDSVKKYADNGDLWVATIKEGGQYENLYHELSLEKYQNLDTMWLVIRNYNKQKYQYQDSSMISIEIPKIISSNVKILNEGTKISETENHYIITTDLKKSNVVKLVLKGLQIYTDTLIDESNDNLFLFSNPAKDELHFFCPGDIISKCILNSDGKIIQTEQGNNNSINISHLRNGLYIIRVMVCINGKLRYLSNKFIEFR